MRRQHLRVPRLGAKRANSSPQGREVGKWSYVLHLLHAALPARFSPAQEIPPQLGFQQPLPRHPQNKGCFGVTKFSPFFAK